MSTRITCKSGKTGLKNRSASVIQMRADRFYKFDAYEEWLKERAAKAMPENHEFFLCWSQFLISERLSLARAVKYITQLATIEKFLQKPFAQATEADLRELVSDVEHHGYSDHYKHDLFVMLKAFFKWLRGTEIYPPEVAWIKSGSPRNRVLPEHLISESEIQAMIDAAESPRDKAIVAVLYESGCRVSEIGTLHIGNVKFDEYGSVITVKGKTGMRRVRLVSAAPYLATWLTYHPRRKELDAPLWPMVGFHSRQKSLRYEGFKTLLGRLGEKAGIGKQVYPHLFRHSRATLLAKHLTEPQMREFFGWVPNSQQPATYVHLSGRDLEDSILQLHGLRPKQQFIDMELRSKDCARCLRRNSPTNELCVGCGYRFFGSSGPPICLGDTNIKTGTPQL